VFSGVVPDFIHFLKTSDCQQDGRVLMKK
jgi:hypothetical protein